MAVRKFQTMDMDDNLGIISKLGPISKYWFYLTKALV